MNPVKVPWSAVMPVYSGSFLLGISLMSFPAAGNVFKTVHLLSDSQYGSIFLPNITLAIIGSLLGGHLARSLGLKRLFLIGLASNLVSMLLFAGSHWAIGSGSWPYALVMLSTGFNGVGYGLGGVATNTYPTYFFPKHRDAAYVALHTVLGLGATLSAQLLKPFREMGMWVGFPFTVAFLYLVVFLYTLRTPIPEVMKPKAMQGEEKSPVTSPLFILFCWIAFLYSMAECTFSNWLVIFLTFGKNLSEGTAAVALSTFWGAMTFGRLSTIFISRWIKSSTLYLCLPVLMFLCFWLIPWTQSPAQAIAFFGLAGLSCSSFFPLTISRAVKTFPDCPEKISSVIPASLAVGIGIGSFLPGPLLNYVTLEEIYKLSSVYPLMILASVILLYRKTGKERGPV